MSGFWGGWGGGRIVLGQSYVVGGAVENTGLGCWRGTLTSCGAGNVATAELAQGRAAQLAAPSGVRHMGHFWCRHSQPSAHFAWKTCWHALSTRTSSLASQLFRQMAQAATPSGPAPSAASAALRRRRGTLHSAACGRAGAGHAASRSLARNQQTPSIQLQAQPQLHTQQQ